MDQPGQWQGRPAVASTLRILIVLLPVAVAVAVSLAAAYALPIPRGLGPTILWWAAILASSAAVMLAGEVAARRLLPLVALLRLSLLFPGPAPSRLAVSRHGSRRELQALVARVKEHGLGDDAGVGAHTLVRLIAGLDAHDRRTRGHSERVRAVTDLLADRLHIDEDGRNKLRWAALLHDIGKLEVPFEVLNKPGPLDDHEWAMIHRHPEDGDRMLGGLKAWLGEYSEVVLEHHERWDGDGYPRGLAGEDITYGARIVAVADSYDVMTSVRSYQRKPKAQAAALEEVVRCAGSQFDPEVARTMVNVSTRRLWLVLGPLAWLAQIPLLGPIATVGAGSQVATVGAGAVTSVAFASGTRGGPGGLVRSGRPPRPISTTTTGVPTTTIPTTTIPTTTIPTTTTAATTSTGSGPSSTSSTAPDPTTSVTVASTTTAPRTTTTTTVRSDSVTLCAPAGQTRPTTSTSGGTTSTVPSRSPPEAVDDTVDVRPGATVDIPVLANDRDPDGDLDRATLRLASAPTSGTATVVGGRVRYVARPGISGTDRFAYAVETRSGTCTSAAILVRIR